MPPDRLKPPPKPEGVVVLNRLFLTQYHMRLLTLFGGAPGWRHQELLDQALELARSKAGASGEGDVFEVAAAYAWGLAKAPFQHGNLRLGVAAIAACLGMNAYAWHPPGNGLLEVMRRLGDGQISFAELTFWIKSHSVKVNS